MNQRVDGHVTENSERSDQSVPTLADELWYATTQEILGSLLVKGEATEASESVRAKTTTCNKY